MVHMYKTTTKKFVWGEHVHEHQTGELKEVVNKVGKEV